MLSDSYTESFLPAGTSLPAVLLQTVEGRAVFLSSWKASTLAELITALDAEDTS